MNHLRYAEQQRFIDALRQWQGKPYLAFPDHRPPCGVIVGADPENRVLADIFARLCAMSSTAERTTYVLVKIETYRRHVRIAESTVRGVANPRLVGAEASREAWSKIKPIEAMIDALEQWRDGLLEIWDGEIGVQFIEDAARRAS